MIKRRLSLRKKEDEQITLEGRCWYLPASSAMYWYQKFGDSVVVPITVTSSSGITETGISASVINITEYMMGPTGNRKQYTTNFSPYSRVLYVSWVASSVKSDVYDFFKQYCVPYPVKISSRVFLNAGYSHARDESFRFRYWMTNSLLVQAVGTETLNSYLAYVSESTSNTTVSTSRLMSRVPPNQYDLYDFEEDEYTYLLSDRYWYIDNVETSSSSPRFQAWFWHNKLSPLISQWKESNIYYWKTYAVSNTKNAVWGPQTSELNGGAVSLYCYKSISVDNYGNITGNQQYKNSVSLYDYMSNSLKNTYQYVKIVANPLLSIPEMWTTSPNITYSSYHSGIHWYKLRPLTYQIIREKDPYLYYGIKWSTNSSAFLNNGANDLTGRISWNNPFIWTVKITDPYQQ